MFTEICGAAYYGKLIGKLSELHHGVSGEVYAVDGRTLFIKDFTYDGEHQVRMSKKRANFTVSRCTRVDQTRCRVALLLLGKNNGARAFEQLLAFIANLLFLNQRIPIRFSFGSSIGLSVIKDFAILSRFNLQLDPELEQRIC